MINLNFKLKKILLIRVPNKLIQRSYITIYFLGGPNFKKNKPLQDEIIQFLEKINKKDKSKEPKLDLFANLKKHPGIFILNKNKNTISTSHETTVRNDQPPKYFNYKNLFVARILDKDNHRIVSPGLQIKNDDNNLIENFENQFKERLLNYSSNELISFNIENLQLISVYAAYNSPLNFQKFLASSFETFSSSSYAAIAIKEIALNPISVLGQKETKENQIKDFDYGIEYFELMKTNKVFTAPQVIRYSTSQIEYADIKNDVINDTFNTSNKEPSSISLINSDNKKRNINLNLILADDANKRQISVEKTIVFYHSSADLDLIYPDFSSGLNKKYSADEQAKILQHIFNDKSGENIFIREAALLHPIDAVHSALYKIKNSYLIDLPLTEEQFNSGEALAKSITFYN